MRIFIGVDPRSPVAYNVLQWSIIRRASKPVSIVPLVLPQLTITRKGLTDFTFSRYMVPHLSGYQGASVFMDADMLVLGDVAELFDFMDGQHSVYVASHLDRFEWPSMMLFNNAECKELTPDYIENEKNQPQSLSWAKSIGKLPPEWNFCVGYDEPTEDYPKLVHYTAGIPAFYETRNLPYAQAWLDEYESMTQNCSWIELMGGSVHQDMVLKEIEQRRKAWAQR